MAGNDEEQENISLEEKLNSLREQGMSMEEAVRQIFQEDINASPGELARITGLDSLSIGRLKGSVTRTKGKKKGTKPPPPPSGGVGEGSPSLYKGETDTTAILSSILEGHPDVPSKVQDEVIRVSTLKGGLHPMELPYVLASMKGISSNTANILAWKYSLALQKAQAEGNLVIPFQWTSSGAVNQGSGGLLVGPQTIFGGGQGTGPGGQPGSSPYLTRDEFVSLQRQSEERRRADAERREANDRMDKMEKGFVTAVSDLKDSFKSELERFREGADEGRFEVIEQPVDEDGKPCAIDKAVTIQRIRRPIAVRGGEEGFLDQLIKLRNAGIIPKGELTEEAVRRIVKDEKGGTPKEDPRITEMKEELKNARDDVSKLKDTIEDKEKQRLIDKIDDLEKKITAIPTMSAGAFKNEEIQVLVTTIQEAARIIREKKPMETAKEILIPPTPSEKVVQPGAREGIEARVSAKYIAEH